MTLCTSTDNVKEEEMEKFLDFMSESGKFDRIPEKLIDAGMALSGCGPAFVCLFMEALADGAVACGVPRKSAMEYAAQMILGTVTLMQETGKHPAVMKDEVCSPAGTTIAGVRALEEHGFRSAAMEAVIAAFEKTKALK
jgi:pyrroline-5-carboxylate reductase